MRILTDYAIVKFEKLLEDEHKIKGQEGRKILLAVAQDPARNVRNYGELVSVPKKLSDKLIFAVNALGPPLYHRSSPNEVIYMNQVEIELEPGYRVYVHHNAIVNALRDPDLIIKEEKQDDDTTHYWVKVMYQDIFCAIVDGQYKMNATWTLVKPDFETWDDILKPIPEIDDDGNLVLETVKQPDENGVFQTIRRPKMKPKEQWLQLKVRPEAIYLRGFVEAVGKPLKNEPQDIHIGDHIIYRKNADFEVTIEGINYFLIKQRHIRGFIEKSD